MAHICHAIGCTQPCRPTELMDKAHWQMVPLPLRQAVWAAYQPGLSPDRRHGRDRRGRTGRARHTRDLVANGGRKAGKASIDTSPSTPQHAVHHPLKNAALAPALNIKRAGMILQARRCSMIRGLQRPGAWRTLCVDRGAVSRGAAMLIALQMSFWSAP